MPSQWWSDPKGLPPPPPPPAKPPAADVASALGDVEDGLKPPFVNEAWCNEFMSAHAIPHSSTKVPGAACCGYKQWPFLRTGLSPLPGHGLMLRLNYQPLPDIPSMQKGWLNLHGHVAAVLPTPTESEVDAQIAAGLLPPRWGCECCMSRASEMFGAAHGQRVQGVVKIKDEEWTPTEGPLLGSWAVELVCDHNKESVWQVSKMVKF